MLKPLETSLASRHLLVAIPSVSDSTLIAEAQLQMAMQRGKNQNSISRRASLTFQALS